MFAGKEAAAVAFSILQFVLQHFVLFQVNDICYIFYGSPFQVG